MPILEPPSEVIEEKSLVNFAQTTEIEREYFDSLIREHGDFNPFLERGWNTISRRFGELVPVRDAVDLLDIGCGTGQSFQLYSGYVKSYVGIDLSGAALRFARKTHPASSWICADATRLPFEDGRFGVVAFSSVLHHIPEFSVALREARRVLVPGGYVFAFDPNLLHPAMALFRYPNSPFYQSQGVSPNEKPLLPATLRLAFEKEGFREIRQRCQSDIPFRRVAPVLMNAALGAYNAGDWLWERVGLGRWFGTFVITSGQKPLEPGLCDE